MPPTMTTAEAIEMMTRCRTEIVQLRATIKELAPKADAYDNLAALIRMFPRPGVGMGEDLVWIIDKRIRELAPSPTDSGKEG